ncbi:nicotinate-nucleotide--dimethylbenzimidazole phosphoribosyltransferase [Nitratireductor kimnyeongensis]|uniref:Nicotinate-nucleotide--dimethylbenzimidazole phosphoribosyltransferase n=1 Tax=Nitratireductor kimnyeongensis TaxID=430679 RepID=A0ABW0TAB2_9HYPH|nr:nicotinate-nucleotide--dimethylbenzimidazole phosphoribosyltransferase [Nitratireductor kimnyeongensis]QZZ35722.1 nicotinate-nucleotide--dimethylbenzimidazole phosphoribosyltransferase [Nitratireductor kimnyeongensis]
MSFSGLPFDDVRSLLSQLNAPDEGAAAAMSKAFARAGYTGKELGRLHEIGVWLARTRGAVPPLIGKSGVALYAATHGFSDTGLSEQRARVDAVAAGAAAVSHLCVANDLSLNVFDLALDLPSNDMRNDASLDERACAATIAFGMEATAEGGDLLCVGALGEQASVAARAILLTLLNGELAQLSQSDGDVISEAFSHHAEHLTDPLEVLRRLGGRDISALTGAILASRAQNIPVILDGLPALAAAAVLHKLAPHAISHCALANCHDPFEAWVAEELALQPVLELQFTGEAGCAGAVAAGLVKSAAALAGGVAEVAKRLH